MYEKFALLFSGFMKMGCDGGDDDDKVDGTLVVMGVQSKTLDDESIFSDNLVLCWMTLEGKKATYVPLSILLTHRQIEDMKPVNFPSPLRMTDLFYSKLVENLSDSGIDGMVPDFFQVEGEAGFDRDGDFDTFLRDNLKPWENN